jgi:RNA polymerase sigma-54 factor
MKISLQLKLGQSLSMTPQLQQAIKLLQLSTLDLQQEISQALESNPMLELIEHDDADGDSEREASEYEILKDDQGSARESGEPEYQAERQSKSDAEEQDGSQTGAKTSQPS